MHVNMRFDKGWSNLNVSEILKSVCLYIRRRYKYNCFCCRLWFYICLNKLETKTWEIETITGLVKLSVFRIQSFNLLSFSPEFSPRLNTISDEITSVKTMILYLICLDKFKLLLQIFQLRLHFFYFLVLHWKEIKALALTVSCQNVMHLHASRAIRTFAVSISFSAFCRRPSSSRSFWATIFSFSTLGENKVKRIQYWLSSIHHFSVSYTLKLER